MMPEMYAKALFEATKKKSRHDSDHIVGHFVALLKRRGHFTILPRVIRQLSRLLFEEERRGGVVVTFASDADRELLQKGVEREAAKIGISGPITEQIDETVVGGFHLRSGNIVLDGSHKRLLLALYERLRKAALESQRANELTS